MNFYDTDGSHPIESPTKTGIVVAAFVFTASLRKNAGVIIALINSEITALLANHFRFLFIFLIPPFYQTNANTVINITKIINIFNFTLLF